MGHADCKIGEGLRGEGLWRGADDRIKPRMTACFIYLYYIYIYIYMYVCLIYLFYVYVCMYVYIRICSYIIFVVELAEKSFDTCEGRRLVCSCIFHNIYVHCICIYLYCIYIYVDIILIFLIFYLHAIFIHLYLIQNHICNRVGEGSHLTLEGRRLLAKKCQSSYCRGKPGQKLDFH